MELLLASIIGIALLFNKGRKKDNTPDTDEKSDVEKGIDKIKEFMNKLSLLNEKNSAPKNALQESPDYDESLYLGPADKPYDAFYDYNGDVGERYYTIVDNTLITPSNKGFGLRFRIVPKSFAISEQQNIDFDLEAGARTLNGFFYSIAFDLEVFNPYPINIKLNNVTFHDLYLYFKRAYVLNVWDFVNTNRKNNKAPFNPLPSDFFSDAEIDLFKDIIIKYEADNENKNQLLSLQVFNRIELPTSTLLPQRSTIIEDITFPNGKGANFIFFDKSFSKLQYNPLLVSFSANISFNADNYKEKTTHHVGIYGGTAPAIQENQTFWANQYWDETSLQALRPVQGRNVLTMLDEHRQGIYNHD
jgi:hypothetical protein